MRKRQENLEIKPKMKYNFNHVKEKIYEALRFDRQN